jgi:hypothetical protein
LSPGGRPNIFFTYVTASSTTVSVCSFSMIIPFGAHARNRVTLRMGTKFSRTLCVRDTIGSETTLGSIGELLGWYYSKTLDRASRSRTTIVTATGCSIVVP